MDVGFKSPISDTTARLFVLLLAGVLAVLPLVTVSWIPWPVVAIGYIAFVAIGYKVTEMTRISTDWLFIVLIGAIVPALLMHWAYDQTLGRFLPIGQDALMPFYLASVIVILRELGKRKIGIREPA